MRLFRPYDHDGRMLRRRRDTIVAISPAYLAYSVMDLDSITCRALPGVLSTPDAHKAASGYSRQPLRKLDSRSCSTLAIASLLVLQGTICTSLPSKSNGSPSVISTKNWMWEELSSVFAAIRR